MSTNPPAAQTALSRAAKRDLVQQQLEALCDSLQPGDRIPTHTELMRRFGASERSVLRALEELQRQGKIIRRHGSGTFVADKDILRAEPILPEAATDSRTVVVIARPDQSFFDRCVELLFEHTAASDIALLLRPFDPSLSAAVTAPTEHRPMGFILFRWDLVELAQKLQDAGNRVVLVGVPPVDITPPVPSVYGDHEQGGYLAARHLIELGHRRIALVGFADATRTLRWQGFLRAVREAQRSKIEIAHSVLTTEEIAAWAAEPERAKTFFAVPGAPTGLTVWNDHEATALLAVLGRAGVKVPDHVSLVGYDDLPEGQRVYPTLTTVDAAIAQQLHAALSILARPVAPPPGHTVVVLPALVPRESSAPPRIR